MSKRGKDVYLITGGTGLVGSALIDELLLNGHEVHVLTRSKRSAARMGLYYHQYKDLNLLPDEPFLKADRWVHLAGANVAEGRWSRNRKAELYASRVDFTLALMKHIQALKTRFKQIIASSAVGYYGGHKSMEPRFDEGAAAGDDFLAKLCVAWEEAHFKLSSFTDSLSILRLGLVLSSKGGIIAKLKPLFRFYQGAVLGSGEQPFSWIHIEDLIGIMLWKDLGQGIYNAVGKQEVSNEHFTVEFNATLGTFSLLPKAPAFLIKWVFGEKSTLFLEGSNAVSERLLKENYPFKYPTLKEALKGFSA
jgi:uncharacterized protein (TIGR01777 family)